MSYTQQDLCIWVAVLGTDAFCNCLVVPCCSETPRGFTQLMLQTRQYGYCWDELEVSWPHVLSVSARYGLSRAVLMQWKKK